MSKKLELPVAALLVLTFGVGLVACVKASKRNRSYKQSYKFQPCGKVDSADPRGHAMAATILALKESKGEEEWNYVQILPDKFKVRARNCVRGSKDHCATLAFVVTKSGLVRVNELAGQPVPAEMWDDMHRWMTTFRADYYRFKCFEDDALRSAVEPYGYEF